MSGPGSGMILSQSRYQRAGPYYVPGFSKVSGILHWSRKGDQEREFYWSRTVNRKETGNFIS